MVVHDCKDFSIPFDLSSTITSIESTATESDGPCGLSHYTGGEGMAEESL